jgi:hypothetical protein
VTGAGDSLKIDQKCHGSVRQFVKIPEYSVWPPAIISSGNDLEQYGMPAQTVLLNQVRCKLSMACQAGSARVLHGASDVGYTQCGQSYSSIRRCMMFCPAAVISTYCAASYVIKACSRRALHNRCVPDFHCMHALLAPLCTGTLWKTPLTGRKVATDTEVSSTAQQQHGCSRCATGAGGLQLGCLPITDLHAWAAVLL